MRNMILPALILLFTCTIAGPAYGAEPILSVENPLVSLELKNVPLRPLLMKLGQQYDFNIIVDERVEGNISLSVKDVPLWDAMDSVLQSAGYTHRQMQSGLHVVSLQTETDRLEQDMESRQFRLKYLRLTDKLLASVRELMGKRGRVVGITENNTVIVYGSPHEIKRVSRLMDRLDVRPRQILIEASIIEVGKQFSRSLGINWGASDTYITADAMGGMGQVTQGMNLDLPGQVTSVAGINLPEVSSESGFNLGFGLVADSISLQMQINALEQEGKARLVSSPRVQVLNNHKAVISEGQELLFYTRDSASVVTASDGEVSAEFEAKPHTFQAKLQLEVTPRVIDDGSVALLLDVDRDEFDFQKIVEGYPTKLTRSASTDLILQNRQTVVIGGINTTRKVTLHNAVPWLSSIPILGWLFKSQTTVDRESELLIFITPTIIEDYSEQTLQKQDAE